MLKLLKTGAAVATATTVIAVSLMTGPAANAATHKVANDNKHTSTTVKVVGHTDKLVLDAASKKAVAVQFKHLGVSKTYMAAKYAVSLKHGKKVLYHTTTTTYRALDTQIQVSLASAKYKNDAAVKKVVKHTLALSESAAKADLTKTLDNAVLEGSATYISTIVDLLKKEIAASPNATWEDLSIDTATRDAYSPTSGIRIKIDGTPQAFTVTLSGKYTSASYVYTSTTDSYQKINWVNYPGLANTFKL